MVRLKIEPLIYSRPLYGTGAGWGIRPVRGFVIMTYSEEKWLEEFKEKPVSQISFKELETIFRIIDKQDRMIRCAKDALSYEPLATRESMRFWVEKIDEVEREKVVL